MKKETPLKNKEGNDDDKEGEDANVDWLINYEYDENDDGIDWET